MAPKKTTPLAKGIYWKLLADVEKTDFSPKQYSELAALKCVVSYNRYGGYCVPKSSRRRPAARAILSGKVWEPQTIDFIITNCSNGDVVHAGTFFGDFLPALSKGVATSSTVWAFEPNPENYRCARITLKINDLDNVVLTNAGLGARREVLFLQTRDENGRALGGTSRIIAKGSKEATHGEAIQILTIDETVGSDRIVSIIQLDVEGHEKEALSGALKTIERCLPILILEVMPNSTLLDSEWFAENILRLGYRRIKNLHSNAVLIADHNDK
jgi:FkbM family methyltransferase